MAHPEACPRILCVDDEPRVLDGIQRTLGLDYEVSTATSGAQALELLKSSGPFAVTVSDMRMPGMDGAAYLKRATEVDSTCVRMLLTGHADLEATIKAVNEGRLFRFLTKPCTPEALRAAVEDAVNQHRLILAEKQLLEQTLYGMTKVLTDLLSLANPVAFSRASRVKRIVSELASELGVDGAWQFELAIMLAHVGCVGLPQELLTKAYNNQPIDAKERELVLGAPRLAHSLLENIPRLEVTLGILSELGAHKPPPLKDVQLSTQAGRVAWGTHAILLAERADQLRLSLGTKNMLSVITNEKQFDPFLLAALAKIDPGKLAPVGETGHEERHVTAQELKIGMVLVEDVRSKAGVLMIKAGQEVTPTVAQLLRKMSARDNLVEPLKVAAAARHSGAASPVVRIRL